MLLQIFITEKVESYSDSRCVMAPIATALDILIELFLTQIIQQVLAVMHIYTKCWQPNEQCGPMLECKCDVQIVFSESF